jgi:hypothetical protein
MDENRQEEEESNGLTLPSDWRRGSQPQTMEEYNEHGKNPSD